MNLLHSKTAVNDSGSCQIHYYFDLLDSLESEITEEEFEEMETAMIDAIVSSDEMEAKMPIILKRLQQFVSAKETLNP